MILFAKGGCPPESVKSSAPQSKTRRSRLLYATLALACVLFGLASRNPRFHWPEFMKEYGGDTLWAAMVFFVSAAIWNRKRTWVLAVAVALFSLAVELSQLWQADWLNSVRDTRIGALILGRGFLWSDLICYVAGVAFGAVVDWIFQRRRFQSRPVRLTAGSHE